MADTQHVSLRVDRELWRRVRLAAIGVGIPASQWVAEAVDARLAVTEPAFMGAVAKATSAPARPVTTVYGADRTNAMNREYDEAWQKDETRCQCGQRWKDHRAGSSGKVAVATNCRDFRVSA